MPNAKKVVLVSKGGYNPSHNDFLRSLIKRRICLFCAVGKDCVLWEDVMDELVVGPTGEYVWHVTTTSHPNESIEDVVEFAKLFLLTEPTTVEVIEV